MDTLTLLNCLKQIAVEYRIRYAHNLRYKVLPSDMLPKKLSNECHTIIVNTDSSKKPGLHWQAIWFTAHNSTKRKCIFFYSYGFEPKVKTITQFINTNSKQLEFNEQQLQSFDSKVCGEYCAVFLMFKAHGKSLKMFLKNFSSTDFEHNDRKIKKMFNKYFKKSINIVGQRGGMCKYKN